MAAASIEITQRSNFKFFLTHSGNTLQGCHCRQITMPAAGRMLFLAPNQHCKSTEGKVAGIKQNQ